MTDKSFFEISKEQSRIKVAIVSKYFEAWAIVMMGVQDRAKGKDGDTIAYIDLFAGPGRYDDGTKSTPLLILEKAIASDKLRNRLVTIFNDKDAVYTTSLEEEIKNLPGVEALKHRPHVYNEEVGTEIVKVFERMKMIPTFFFLDPCGYKGLSLELINSVVKDWGCDCIFFFNYNRVNMALTNELVDDPMNALFGKERADRLRKRIEGISPSERELMIVEELCQAIKEFGKRYILPFRFRNEAAARTSHHLIFITKDVRGILIMKDIIAREGSAVSPGIVSFEYNPASIRQPFLFQWIQPQDIENRLLEHFAGRTLTFRQIRDQHTAYDPYTPYAEKDYREALLEMEAEEKITTDPPVERRRKRKGKITFGEDVKVTFPPKRKG